MKFKNLILLPILLLWVVGSIVAQKSWSLEQCIDYAMEHSLVIDQMDFSVQNAEINLTQSQHQRYPNLNAGTNFGMNFGRTIDPTTNSFVTQNFLSNGYSLSSGVLLYNGGRIRNTINQSSQELRAAKRDKEQSKRDLALNVASMYLNGLFALENLQNAKGQLELSNNQLEQVNRLIETGARPRNEQLDILAQISTIEQQLVTAENNYAIAILNLKQLINLDPSEEMSLLPPPDVPSISDPDQLNLLEVYTNALGNQPNIEAGELRARSAEYGINVAKSGYLPSLTLAGNVGTNYSNQGVKIVGEEEILSQQDIFLNGQAFNLEIPSTVPVIVDANYLDQIKSNLSYGFGVNLSIPIYSNYSNKANVERSKLNLKNINNQNEQLKQNLKSSIMIALTDARAAKRQLEASQKTFEAREASYQNAQKRFELGAINSYDYVSIKNQYDTAQINMLIAKYDYLFKVKVLDFYQGHPLHIN